MIEDELIQVYIKNLGTQCLYCQATETEDQGPAIYDEYPPNIFQEVLCLACGKSWRDWYKLSGVVEE